MFKTLKMYSCGANCKTYTATRSANFVSVTAQFYRSLLCNTNTQPACFTFPVNVSWSAFHFRLTSKFLFYDVSLSANVTISWEHIRSPHVRIAFYFFRKLCSKLNHSETLFPVAKKVCGKNLQNLLPHMIILYTNILESIDW